MKAQTIEQYKILQWISENFEDNTISVEWTGRNTALLTDTKGETMNVEFQNGKVNEI